MSENSTSVLFADSKPIWFVSVDNSWVGPFRAEEVFQKLQAGDLQWTHYCWREGFAEARRLCDEPAFQVSTPKAPDRREIETLKASLKPVVKQSGRTETRLRWFLYTNKTQIGPFDANEVRRLIELGRVQASEFAWSQGMETWARLGEIPDFQSEVEQKKLERDDDATVRIEEQRKTPRRPLVAQIRLTDGKVVTLGICRDISVGGMQVLTETLPAQVGEQIRLNVSPSGPVGINPFVARGIIVRTLEDGRGFSFRFDQLTDEAREIIEKYLKS